MTFAQLRIFLAVARLGSVKGAAAELSVTQPAISAGVAALERDVGVSLLAREGRGVRLTPAGEVLARYAATSLGLLEQGRDAATAAAHAGQGRLRLVAVTTAGEYVVPPLLKVFKTRVPDVEVILEVGNRALVNERLLERRADLGIGGRPPEGGQIEGSSFLDNKLVIVGSPDHERTGRRPVDPGQLDDVWLLREPGSGTAATTEEFLAAHGIKPRRILRLGSNGAVKQAASVGLGITLISAHAVSLELSAGTLVRLRVRDTPIDRQWFALHLGREFLPGPAELFLDFVQTATARRAVGRAQPAVKVPG
jgi:LysR family transcriptional regulator, low CO2-responsive transcriptional regulator